MIPLESIAKEAPAERRRSPRHDLLLAGVATLNEQSEVTVQLHELSRTGFLMECSGPLGVGEKFSIRLEGSGEFSARAIWACGSLIGCEFQRKLSLQDCNEALMKARSVPKKPIANLWVEREQAANDAAFVDELGHKPRAAVVALVVAASVLVWAGVGLVALNLLG